MEQTSETQKIKNSEVISKAYSKMGVGELKKLLEERKIDGRSKLTKKESMVKVLELCDQDPDDKKTIKALIAELATPKKTSSSTKSKDEVEPEKEVVVSAEVTSEKAKKPKKVKEDKVEKEDKKVKESKETKVKESKEPKEPKVKESKEPIEPKVKEPKEPKEFKDSSESTVTKIKPKLQKEKVRVKTVKQDDGEKEQAQEEAKEQPQEQAQEELKAAEPVQEHIHEERVQEERSPSDSQDDSPIVDQDTINQDEEMKEIFKLSRDILKRLKLFAREAASDDEFKGFWIKELKKMKKDFDSNLTLMGAYDEDLLE